MMAAQCVSSFEAKKDILSVMLILMTCAISLLCNSKTTDHTVHSDIQLLCCASGPLVYPSRKRFTTSDTIHTPFLLRILSAALNVQRVNTLLKFLCPPLSVSTLALPTHFFGPKLLPIIPQFLNRLQNIIQRPVSILFLRPLLHHLRRPRPTQNRNTRHISLPLCFEGGTYDAVGEILDYGGEF
jgi:hypothetical protein